MPPIEPTVDEYRLHRLEGPRCGTATSATLPPGVPTGAFGARTDGESGSRFVERMLTMVATCRQQGINVLDDLTRCYQVRLDGEAAPSLLPPVSAAEAA